MPALLAGGLLILLTAFVALGLSQLTRSSSGGFVNWISENVLATFLGGKWIADQIIKLTSWLAHEIGKHFEEVSIHAVQWISALNTYLQVTARVALEWPIELFRLQEWLVWHEIPKLAKGATSVITSVVHRVTTTVRRVERTVYVHVKLTKAQIAAALAVALPGAILKDIPFGRTVAQIRRRFRRLTWIAAYSTAAALVSAALVKMGLNWIRCRNVAKTGKALCGVPSKWLLNALTGLVAVFGTLSLVTFAHEVYEVLSDGVDQIRHFWRADVSAGGLDPDLGEIGSALVGLRPKGYKSPTPDLGDAF